VQYGTAGQDILEFSQDDHYERAEMHGVSNGPELYGVCEIELQRIAGGFTLT
jgi:hypothetical protein